MDELLSEFLTECCESMATLDAELVLLERQPADGQRLDSIFRVIHTIKGTCGFLGLARLERVAHAAENVLGLLREGRLAPTPEVMAAVFAAVDRIRIILDGLAGNGAEPTGDDTDVIASLGALTSADRPALTLVQDEPAAADEPPGTVASAAVGAVDMASEPSAAHTLRVRLDHLETLMTLVGELVLARNQLLQAARHAGDGDIASTVQRLNRITTELQETVMRTRLQPIGNAWTRLPRLVRDLAHELGKDIELVLDGGDTELDREILEHIKDPLTHMVRNSADHGLESPAERRRAGKPERGRIRLAAGHEGGYVVIRLADDGRGLDLEAIAAKALASRLASQDELAAMSPEQLGRLIFHPGLSTAERVSSVSGRGVGMDVVRSNIERLGGIIDLSSEPGRGTAFTVRIPLTLAIVSVLIVGAGGQRFGIRQLDVVELVRAGAGTEHPIERVGDAPMLRLRDRLFPLLTLTRLLGLPGEPPDPARAVYVVLARIGSGCVGLIVDHVFDTEEVVVKPLAPVLRTARIYAGNTILGDGGVIMILDLEGFQEMVASRPTEAGDGSTEAALAEERTSLLLFRAGGPAPRAVPLGLVTRLEEVAAQEAEHCDGRSVVQYRGRLMPLVEIDGTPARFEGGSRPVIVFTDSGRHMGLVVDEILDIAEAGVGLELKASSPGSLGGAVIRGRTTDLLDVAYFVHSVFGGWFADREQPPFAATPSGEQSRILLVDDSAFFRNLLKPILESSGYKVVSANGPTQALRLRDSGERFDVIVSDIEMPDMNGFDFAAACRAGGRWRSTPMIALSSHTAADDIARSRSVGFTNHVGKLDRTGLLEALGEARRIDREAA